jgi:signal transduction histidine kinase
MALVVLDEALRVHRANQEFYRIIQRAPAETEGRLFGELAGGQWDTPDLRAMLERVLSGEASVRECEMECAIPGIGMRVVRFHAHPIILQDSESRLALLCVEDITQRRQAESQVQVYQKRLQRLAFQLITVEDRERRRIATDLHDRIGQALSAIQMRIGLLRSSRSFSDPSEALDKLYALIDQTVQDTRSLTFEISPPVLYALGLEAALESLAEQFQKLHGLEVTVQDDGQPKPLDDDLSALLFRSVRELLFNVVKHTRAAQARISLRRDRDQLRIEVADDGPGFDPVQAMDDETRADSFGLFSIRERLNAMGGYLQIDSAPGQGTQCILVVPMPLEEKSD